MPGKAEFLQPSARLAHEGCEILSTVGWLSRVAPGFRDAMLDIAMWRVAEPGVEFVHNGVDSGGMFAIVRGTAEASLYLGHPDTRMIYIAPAGFWAGIRPLIGRTRQVSLRARDEVVWGLFPQYKVERLLDEEPSWWKHIDELADDALMIAMGIMSDLSFQDSRKRAIAVLLRAAGCRYADPSGGYSTPINISQADLAAMAVMSRNTFQAIVGQVAAQGLIEHGYRSIVIMNPGILRAILDD
jgi:CRP-like cAMP-binding protein